MASATYSQIGVLMARWASALALLCSSLASETLPRQTIMWPAGTFTYGFTGAGRRLASLAMPGSITTNVYDAAGELLSVGVTNSAHTALDYHGYEYNENSWITAAHRLGGVTANYTYDNIGQLLSANAYEPDNTTLRLNENLDYTYDASHNLATRTANTLTQAFTSDAANQLASITRSGTLTVSGSITGAVATLGVNGQPAAIYSDGTFATTSGLTLRDGNNMFVTTGSNSSGALMLSTISSNRLPVTVSFGYDLNGNLTSDGQRVLEYDDANQLIAVTAPNLYRTEFVYDGLSRRRIVREYTWAAGSWQSAGETDYVCDGYLPLQERDASGNVLVTYTRGPDLSGTFGGAGGIGGLLARTDSSGSAFYHADIVGNITSLTDGNGNSVARYLQDSFGRPLGMWGPMGPGNRMQVSSMPTDPSGGVHFPYRDYDTILQRFRTRDLLGERADINPYRINYNNSLSYIDPDGLAPQVVTASYNLTSGAMSVGYADSQFGQGYGIGLHGPLGPGGEIALTTGATMMPGVGEAMDLSVLTDPESRWWELGLAGASLGLNVLTDGLLPNAGGFIRAGKKVCRTWPMHHPWPEYLGGLRDQTLKKMPRKLHEKFHADLDAWEGGKYARAHGAEHFEGMNPDQIIGDLRQFYKKNYPDYLGDFDKAVRESSDALKGVK